MRLGLVFVGLALVFLLSWALWGGALEERFTVAGAVAWLEGTGRWAWLAGTGLLVSDIVLPVPGTVVMSALGYLYGVLGGGLLAAAGSMAAGITGYGLCRMLGERAARRLLGDLEFERGRLLFARGGGWMIALSRALPILPEALACTAGLVRMPFGRFVLALACGSVPIGFLFAAVGAAGKESPGWALAVSLVVPALLWLAARRIVSRR
jgi:uncharacterized membrane protein YdjX (TVP38/TMEM64 family)